MIRTATVKDAEQIAAFWNSEIRETLITFNSVEKSPSDIASMIVAKSEEGFGFLVAEELGQILGFATYGQFRGGIGYQHTAEQYHSCLNLRDGDGIQMSSLL